MKHRTKNNPSDDFKFVVNYEVELSIEEQRKLEQDVPSTPKVTDRMVEEHKGGPGQYFPLAT